MDLAPREPSRKLRLVTSLRLWGLVLVALGTTWAAVGLVLWVREVRFLRGTLRGIIPGGRIRQREDLVLIKNYLSSHIQYDRRRVNDPRPLLRASARRTLASGHGFCGENARVALWLLGLGGVRAHRVYLDATQWKHILLEHQWEGGWKFFDAHADPATVLPDEAVGRIDSTDIGRLPNAHEGNAYLRSYRLRPFHGIGFFRRFEQIRLPMPVALFLESPALVHTSAGLVALATGLACVSLS
jgi:hypothetical protein